MRPFLHTQVEDASCRGDRDPLIMGLVDTYQIKTSSVLHIPEERRPLCLHMYLLGYIRFILFNKHRHTVLSRLKNTHIYDHNAGGK